ncbi:MAG: cation:proton antiporter [Armatimonadetes bacterium]|nr:cation:proton antiporter [Armatimonadota bacterium]
MVGAKLGGTVFLRLRQPAVLGELVCGVVLGNLLLLLPQTSPGAPEAWYAAFVRSALTHGSPVDILARLGVVLLLFQVGLESDLQAMMRVGATSFVVATIGVVCPFVLGFSVSYLLLPGGPHDPLVHVFVGACLTATSVGITARVLQELGRVDQDESRIVLGAAVIDDVMGLVILAVVSGMVNAKSTGAALSPLAVFRILAFSVGFLFGAVAIGRWLAPRVFMLASRLHGKGLLLITALVICFVLAGCANLIGLAPIVGAFAAGILLDEVHYEELRERHQEHDLELLLLVPVFFVQMGMTVKLSAFGQAGVIGFALLLTLVAIVGKQACGLVVPRRLDRLSVGVGMIPRGEVGLIFAGIGNGLRLGGERVINDVSNAAVVIMVIVTTMVTPPILQWTLARGDRRRARQTLET